MEQDLQAELRQGFTNLGQGNLAAASRCCQRILAAQPDLPQGHFLVGLVALEAKDRKTAFQAFASVTRLDPQHAAAWANLARLFMTDGQVNRADAALEKAVATKVSDPIVVDLIGSVYSLMGEYGLANQFFRQAVSQRPQEVPFLLNLANNLIYHGENEEAFECFESILRLQPDSPQAHWALAGARRAENHEHIRQMSQLLESNPNPRAQAFYFYAIGKEHEDLQEWEAAFDAFSRGAAARRSTVAYDEEAEKAMFAFLAEHFTPTWLEQGPKGHSSEKPIFVLGQPRTGTTLVERVIASHSQVHSAGELQQFGLGIRRLTQHRDPKRFSAELFGKALGVNPFALGKLYLDTTSRMQGGLDRFIDKLPQNYLLIPLILKALPGAKIVHLTRHPMDACFASFKQLFADAYLHSYDLEEMARHHCRYRTLMDLWRDRFPGRFLDVAYEDVVRDLEPNARRLMSYLELPWEDACLRFFEHQGAVSTASAVQVREPTHTRSIGRWKKYATHLGPMEEILTRQGFL